MAPSDDEPHTAGDVPWRGVRPDGEVALRVEEVMELAPRELSATAVWSPRGGLAVRPGG